MSLVTVGNKMSMDGQTYIVESRTFLLTKSKSDFQEKKILQRNREDDDIYFQEMSLREASAANSRSRGQGCTRCHCKRNYSTAQCSCYVKSLVYADKPQTLDHLEDNIRRVIADIQPQMLEKVIENWMSRLDYIRASRGSHMPEIIFKIQPGTRCLPSNVHEMDNYGGGGLMAWAGIMPRKALPVDELLESEDIRCMDWPARSPYFNPMEHVWDALGRATVILKPSPP
ncbi:uncharacterized protein TNCV_3286581 [Trichonephila clavipes]|nr:uncharacterized protein TNCV_3286581 [Trichonephila clavipes]